MTEEQKNEKTPPEATPPANSPTPAPAPEVPDRLADAPTVDEFKATGPDFNVDILVQFAQLLPEDGRSSAGKLRKEFEDSGVLKMQELLELVEKDPEDERLAEAYYSLNQTLKSLPSA